MMGEPFFDCQLGFVGCRALCLKSIMGVRDFEENMHRGEQVMTSIANGRRGLFYQIISRHFFCLSFYASFLSTVL